MPTYQAFAVTDLLGELALERIAMTTGRESVQPLTFALTDLH